MRKFLKSMLEGFSSLRNMDFWALAAVLLLFMVGLISIYSATASRGYIARYFVYRQIIWGLISSGAFLLVFCVGYQRLLKWSAIIYAMVLLLMAFVLVAGTISRGSQSWIDIGRLLHLGQVRIQPSELGKVSLALVLSSWLSRFPPSRFKNFLGALIIAGLSGMLVLLQPDLGTAAVYACVTLGILFAAGAPKKYIGTLIAIALACLPVGWHFLKEYQKLRLLVFINPYLDPLGAGYNVIQSRIAVGAGGLWGKGFLKGTQSKLYFLPEPHTDFIFSVFAEEFGFIGAASIVVLFGFLLYRLLKTARLTKDKRAKMYVVGISAWIWFQVVESIAMSMGLAPVTGLPLPLLSYGGSSLVSISVAFAIVQSIYASTKKQYKLAPD
ncbi:MAG TPA: rod shape-determining protein RodA [Thermovirga lienii]|nr:rod shape-determining protein RodA [Thermovirga lienii]